jgi:hypothetical protein
MDKTSVPTEEWPADLYRSAVTGDVIKDPENPFLEDSDFATGSNPERADDEAQAK